MQPDDLIYPRPLISSTLPFTAADLIGSSLFSRSITSVVTDFVTDINSIC